MQRSKLQFKIQNDKFILFLSLFILTLYFIISLYFLDKVYFLCPIEYKGDIVIRSDGRGGGRFGAERSGRRLHQGLDLFAKVDTPVLAGRSGRVAVARHAKGMGNFVVIKHPQNMITIYGHLSKINVVKNQFVRQGDAIGAVGKTGNANYRDIQPHLHFEIRKNGVPQDPLKYLD
ncbi:MAG TPA: M23 family metallopeptidase [Candidatus Omnitrophota bacterium]|nr:M23 family metallopeptidase [Candidatus Omnitrophota bacterium]